MTDAEAEKIISAAKEACLDLGKPTVEDMLDAARYSAHHFEGQQRVRMLADFITRPDDAVMMQVVRMDSLGLFLEAVQSRPHEVARRLNAQSRR
jgi:hypothetical protein